MDHVIYILYSRNFNKSYVGQSSNLVHRFHSHNKLATKGWTIKFRPWEVVHVEFFKTKKESLIREKWYKTGSGRQAKSNIIERFLKLS